MPAAQKPDNENERLSALNEYEILDTESESAYDDIIELASFICETPIALVSLVDKERQWFKAKKGVDVEETHRDLAFCAHAILNPEELLVVEDATKDDRFSDNDLVTVSPKIRFYAGCPLNTPSGESIGTLCAIDTKPKTISEEQVAALKVLAKNVVALLELNKSRRQQEKLIYKLKESNEELERFAYLASHDLQEPLTMVRSFNSLLEKKYADKLDDEAKKYISISCSSSARMQDLVNDLLNYARLSENDDYKEEVNSETVLDFVLENLSERIDRTKAEITCENMPVIKTNPTRFSRLLQNLVSNALKYQKEGSLPKITISAKDEGNEWLFTVQDNGIGIKKEYVEQIFQPFKRLHGSEEYSGTGIGLAMCKKIVQQMDGIIWVDSTPEVGSTFNFTIPK